LGAFDKYLVSAIRNGTDARGLDPANISTGASNDALMIAMIITPGAMRSATMKLNISNQVG
jgi:hypothetical protein